MIDLQKLEDALRLRKRAKTTIKQYIAIAKILPPTTQELINYLNSVGAHRHRSVLNFCKTAHNLGLLPKEYFEGLPYPDKYPKRIRSPEDLLSPEDVKKLISVARTTKDKAIVSCLFEQFPRVSEFLTLERKHFKFMRGKVITEIPQSKSEEGYLYFVSSKGFIKNWLLERGDHNGLMWFSEHENIPYRFKTQAELTLKEQESIVQSFRSRLKTMVKRAKLNDLDKRIYPHLFRHSGATDAVEYYGEAGITWIGRWSKNSNTPKEYTHLSKGKVEKRVDRRFGLIEPEVEIRKKCFNCGEEDHSGSSRCLSCGTILDISSINLKEDRELLALEIIKHPKVLQALTEAWEEHDKKKIKKKEEKEAK